MTVCVIVDAWVMCSFCGYEGGAQLRHDAAAVFAGVSDGRPVRKETYGFERCRDDPMDFDMMTASHQPGYTGWCPKSLAFSW